LQNILFLTKNKMPENNINQSICGFCKSTNSKILYKTFDIFENNYTINKCNDCNAYFLAPRPSSERLSQAYDLSYYGEKEEKFSSPLVEKVLDFFRNGRSRRVSKYLKSGAKVLDIGCGNGRFLKYLLNYGKYELYGTEMEGNSANRAYKISEINLKIGSLEQNDFSNNYFDAITLFHVIEHLTEPKQVLEIIEKIIKPRGIVVFSFPNIASLQAIIFKGKWLHLDPPRHLFFFSPRDFINIMQNYGFKVVKKHYFSLEQNPFGAVQSTLNLITNKREVFFESLKGNKNYTKQYSKFNLLAQKMFFVFTMPLFAFNDLFLSIIGKSATVEITFIKTNSK